MFYVKIPVKTEEEGIQVVEGHLGVMYWRNRPDGSVQCYPYESNPVSVVAIKPPNQRVEHEQAKRIATKDGHIKEVFSCGNWCDFYPPAG